MMPKKEQKPQIRFKGFTDAWEQRKLDDIANFFAGNGLSWSDISENGTQECILYGNLYTDYGMITDSVVYRTNSPIKKPVFSEYGDVLIPASDTTPTGLARATSIEKSGVLLGGDINIVRPNESVNGSCLSLALNSHKEELLRLIKGTTVRHIHNSEIKDIIVFLPINKSEQEKITSCFKKLDQLITLHQRKYEKLKNIKKSMLEKMFPKNGNKIPEIRFKGFTDDWEQRKFKNTVQIERGGSPRPIEDFVTNSKNGLNWIKIGDAPSMGKYITKTAEKIKPEGLSKTREVHPGDLILSNSMSFGRPYIMTINGCIHDGWLLIRNDKNLYDLQFLCHLLGSENMLHQYKSFAAGSTVNNLNKDLVGNTTVSFPKKAEQSKLGALFDSLDTLITLHQRKYEKLKNIKKSMLEKMFV